MNKIGELTGEQTRELASLITNKTGVELDKELFFVQLDDEYAVDNEGSIYQILSKKEKNNKDLTLLYEGNDCLYNYAEDSADFEDDSEDIQIYSHCTEQADYNYTDRN